MCKFFKTLFICTILTTLIAGQALAFSDQNNQQISGTVAETMDAGGYTYLHIDSGNDMKIWVAIPLTPVKAGDQVVAEGGMVMQNFTSNALNRTFPVIIFSKGIR
jgi:hypothetical protein